MIDERRKNELFQSTYGTKHSKYSYCEPVWKNFYKRSTLISKKIYFPENIKIGEDMIFNYRVWSKCGNGYFINKVIYNYRINDESVMNSDYCQLKDKYEILFSTFEEEIKKIDPKYIKNYSNFIIKQIKKFYLKYGKSDELFEKISILIENDYYKDKIKNSKINSLNFKDKIFLLALKIKSKRIIKALVQLYN